MLGYLGRPSGEDKVCHIGSPGSGSGSRATHALSLGGLVGSDSLSQSGRVGFARAVSWAGRKGKHPTHTTGDPTHTSKHTKPGGWRLAAGCVSTYTRHCRRASMNRRPMGERRLENGMGDHNGVPRRSSIGRCAVASAVRCRSMIHCPARPSPLGWKRLMGKTGLHCGARCGDIAVLVSVLKPFLFRLSLFSPAAVQGTLISACRRTASRVPRSACCSTLMSSSSEPFLFWRWKRSPPGALPADVRALPLGSVSRSLPIRCSASSLPAALPLCRPAFESEVLSRYYTVEVGTGYRPRASNKAGPAANTGHC